MSTQAAQLGEVAKIRNGFAFSSEDFRDIGVPVIRMSDLGESEVTTKRAARVDARFFEELPQFRIARGSLLIGMSGSIGKVAVYAGPEPALQNQRVGLFCIKNDRALEALYLRYFALTLETTLLRHGKGVAVKNVSAEDIEASLIPLPKVIEQKRIAALLEKADRLRRTRRYARQLSDTFLQTVFLEMFGDPTRNLRNWEMGALGEKLSFLTSGSRGWAKYYRTSGDLFLRIQNVGKNRLLLDELTFVQPPQNAEGSRTVVQTGDVLLSITADLGRAAVIPKGLPKAYINQHLALLRLRDIDPVFAAALLSSPDAKRQWDSLDRSAVKSGLNFDDIRGFKTISPPLPLQQKFAGIVRRFERLRAQQREAERQAEHLFQTLLHRAFSSGL